MAQKIDIKKVLGLDQPDPFQGLLLPENMVSRSEDPWAQFAAKYGARPSTPSREPAAVLPGEDLQDLSGMSPEEAKAVFEQQAAKKALTDSAVAAQLGDTTTEDNLEAELQTPPEESTVPAPTNAPSPGGSAVSEGMTFEKYMENLKDSANRADISPWAALIDRYTGGKLAENERAVHKNKQEVSALDQALFKEKLQQERINALMVRDFAKDTKDIMKPYYDAQTAGKELLDAFTPETEGENKGKISVGRVYGILNRLIAIGGGKGTQTEGDISRVWQPFLDTLVARAKAFFGNREWGYISRDRVEDLIQLANSSASRVAENADIRLKDIINHYQRRGLSNAPELMTPYSERVKQVVVIPDQKAIDTQAAGGDATAQAAQAATAAAPKETGTKMKGREELEFDKLASDAEKNRVPTPKKVKK